MMPTPDKVRAAALRELNNVIKSRGGEIRVGPKKVVLLLHGTLLPHNFLTVPHALSFLIELDSPIARC
jgi:hypothetical protein